MGGKGCGRGVGVGEWMLPVMTVGILLQGWGGVVNLGLEIGLGVNIMAPKIKKATVSKKASKKGCSISLTPEPEISQVSAPSEISQISAPTPTIKRRRLQRRDSDERVERIIKDKLLPKFDIAIIEGFPKNLLLENQVLEKKKEISDT